MSNVKLFTVMLLLASVWIFHATMPQKQIAFIPAASDVIKSGQQARLRRCQRLLRREAEKRYIVQWGHELPDPIWQL